MKLDVISKSMIGVALFAGALICSAANANAAAVSGVDGYICIVSRITSDILRRKLPTMISPTKDSGGALHCPNKRYTLVDVSTIAVSGNVGIQGERGDTGAVGPQGVQGPKGDTGAQGPRGDTGATGAQGLRGFTGEKGDNGAAGAAGAQGPQGLKGDTGPRGETGARGVVDIASCVTRTAEISGAAVLEKLAVCNSGEFALAGAFEDLSANYVIKSQLSFVDSSGVSYVYPVGFSATTYSSATRTLTVKVSCCPV